MKSLYQKYVQDENLDSAGVDADIQREYARQREHLERSVASLRKKLTKDSEIHRADNVRIMQENVTLIKEINDLRRELKIARTQVHDLETALGVMRKSQGLQATEGTSNETEKIIKNEDLAQLEKIINIQKGEIRKLRVQIQDIESKGFSRPPSGTKLPPVPVV